VRRRIFNTKCDNLVGASLRLAIVRVGVGVTRNGLALVCGYSGTGVLGKQVNYQQLLHFIVKNKNGKFNHIEGC
jgi:hypothetical protein